jgi:hypothetical protein
LAEPWTKLEERPRSPATELIQGRLGPSLLPLLADGANDCVGEKRHPVDDLSPIGVKNVELQAVHLLTCPNFDVSCLA